jgi:hypothetical protein
MSGHTCTRLPDELSWRFDEIAAFDPERASSLQRAPPPEAILAELETKLFETFIRQDLRVARELAEIPQYGYRAVVQFEVGVELFDWFFNARTGYRAHFRAGYDCGLDFNSQIIELLCRRLGAIIPDLIPCRELNSEFQDCGEATMPKEFLVNSLVLDLSKIWFCTALIRSDGGIIVLPSGIVGPKILLDDNIRWAAPSRGSGSSWLDIKGAFLSKNGLYQPKDPIERAKKLQATGEA